MKKLWDGLGIALSSACVIHCIVVAFLPLFIPSLAYFTHSTWVHIMAGLTILFTSTFAFIPGYKKHGISWIIGIGLTGLLFVGLGVIMEQRFPEELSHGVSIFGSLLLVFAHTKNIQHSQRHQHQCC
jgi:hypothetical protein